MCGIGGLVLTPPGPVKPEWVDSFLTQLRHRGPDDRGWLSVHRGRVTEGRSASPDLFAEVMLFHRRLSILELSAAGHQPMSSPDGRYAIIYNGEIYNYLELRRELQTVGWRFRSQSDTEVLLAAFVQWGVQALPRLVGMFAFAVLDRHLRRLWLVRDFFGIKPLYYARWQEGLAFASEVQTLLELPGIGPRVNPARLYDYLHFGITDHTDETFFAEINQLPQAHYLELSLDDPLTATPHRYWEPDLTREVDLSFQDAAEQVRELFLENIRYHLRSDVPIGAALSGGVDSSAIVMAMRYVDPSLEIRTVSYVASDPTISEERWIDAIADAAGSTASKVTINPDDVVQDLESLIERQGEPFGSTSMYAQARVFQKAREAGIKVMLDGQGADELLGGYPRYQIPRLQSLLRNWRLGDAWRFAQGVSPRNAGSHLLMRAIAGLAPAAVKASMRPIRHRHGRPLWVNAEWFVRREMVDGSAAHHGEGTRLQDALSMTLMKTSLPQLLRYEDRNSMAYSIESRVPFLTPALVNFVFSLPEDYLIGTTGTTKAVFREAMRGLVPERILFRRDKLGFPTPQRTWFLSLSPWVEEVINRVGERKIDLLDLNTMTQQWRRRLQQDKAVEADIWRCLNLLLWVERFEVSVD